MPRHSQISHQRGQYLWTCSIIGAVFSSLVIILGAYTGRWVIVQFAFAALSIACTSCVLLGSHDESVKRAILVTCGLLAPIWFIITALLQLSG